MWQYLYLSSIYWTWGKGDHLFLKVYQTPSMYHLRASWLPLTQVPALGGLDPIVPHIWQATPLTGGPHLLPLVLELPCWGRLETLLSANACICMIWKHRRANICEAEPKGDGNQSIYLSSLPQPEVVLKSPVPGFWGCSFQGESKVSTGPLMSVTNVTLRWAAPFVLISCPCPSTPDSLDCSLSKRRAHDSLSQAQLSKELMLGC